MIKRIHIRIFYLSWVIESFLQEPFHTSDCREFDTTRIFLIRITNGEGEITSHSTTAVIEPYGKHFESISYLPHTTPHTTN